MDKKENKTDFDLSLLDYKELIDLYYKIDEYIDSLNTDIKKYEEESSNE